MAALGSRESQMHALAGALGAVHRDAIDLEVALYRVLSLIRVRAQQASDAGDMALAKVYTDLAKDAERTRDLSLQDAPGRRMAQMFGQGG